MKAGTASAFAMCSSSSSLSFGLVWDVNAVLKMRPRMWLQEERKAVIPVLKLRVERRVRMMLMKCVDSVRHMSKRQYNCMERGARFWNRANFGLISG